MYWKGIISSMHKWLSKIDSAIALHSMTNSELQELAEEMREVLCNLLKIGRAHV